MSDRLELCVFRHGRTVWNALGKYQGHADVELDELGYAQATRVGQRVDAMAPAALYVSDLRRCTDTAAPIRVPSLEAIRDERLRERDVGTWSGCTRDEIKARDPEGYRLWIEGSEVRPGGGETAAELVERARSFLDFIVDTHRSGTVVAVSHGGWIKSTAQWILNGRVERIGLGVVGQGSLTVFSFADSEWRVEAYNDRGHLLDVEPVDLESPAPPIF